LAVFSHVILNPSFEFLGKRKRIEGRKKVRKDGKKERRKDRKDRKTRKKCF
jgi:hypothetical protein